MHVKDKEAYLFGTVDFSGTNIDIPFSAKRDVVAVNRFFQWTLRGPNHGTPRVIKADNQPLTSLMSR